MNLGQILEFVKLELVIVNLRILLQKHDIQSGAYLSRTGSAMILDMTWSCLHDKYMVFTQEK